MSVHNPNTCANPMAPLQRFRCLRPDHANVWDEHVLARDYDTLATERDQLAAENARLREAMLAVVARLDQPVFNGTESAGHWAANILRADIRSALAVARAALAPATKEGQV